MSDKDLNAFARLEALVDDIENELGGADNTESSAEQPASAPKDGPSSDISSDKIIDIVRHPRAASRILPDITLAEAESKYAGLTDEIWDRLAEQLSEIKPDFAPANPPSTAPDTSSDTPSDMSETASDMSETNDTPGKTPELGPQDEELSALLAGSDQKMESIQRRIDSYWEKHTHKPSNLGASLGFGLSFGFIMVAVLYCAYLLGTELIQRTGQNFWLPLCLILGMIAGFAIGFTLLAPLLRRKQQ
ncbi:hypothetical protein IJT17_04870 [bacterium]|nr:hypothetical protein [bacterium]